MRERAERRGGGGREAKVPLVGGMGMIAHGWSVSNLLAYSDHHGCFLLALGAWKYLKINIEIFTSYRVQRVSLTRLFYLVKIQGDNNFDRIIFVVSSWLVSIVWTNLHTINH
jgi:hypothetical protein